MSKMVDKILEGMEEVTVRMSKIPDFLQVGKEVHVVCGPGSTATTTITAYQAYVFPRNEDMKWVIIKTARLAHWILDDYFEDMEPDAIPFCYLTDKKEQAELWSRVIPVKCSDEDWLKAIGKRQTVEEIHKEMQFRTKVINYGGKYTPSEDLLDGCELEVCCADISAIRDILLKCQKWHGLTVWEVELLEAQMKHGTHTMPENAPILTNILRQLAVKWK